jgi:ADP-heptose:LPS heptosyltransferase
VPDPVPNPAPGAGSGPPGDPTPAFRASAFWRLFPAGMRRRWWLFRPFDLLARAIPFPGPRRGLLVVRMDGIGDMVLFRGALDRHAEAFGVDPSDITVLGCESWGALAKTVFAGYRVVVLNEHRFARNPFYRFRTALRVRALRAKVCVNDAYFRRALMADSLVWLSGAETKVSSLPYISERTRAEYLWYLSQVDRVVDTGPYPTHEMVRHARFLSAAAGRDIAPSRALLTAPDAPVPDAPDGPFALLIPGSNEPGRRWPTASYAALAERLRAKGLAIVLAGRGREVGPDAERRAMTDAGAVDLTDRTTLPQLMALMARAAVVVCNDTGPAHLSIALNAPTVVVVGGGHFTSFVPYPPDQTPPTARFVHHAMDCYHCFWRCHLRADPARSFPCVAAVGVDLVVESCDSVARTR